MEAEEDEVIENLEEVIADVEKVVYMTLLRAVAIEKTYKSEIEDR